ncbi:MAG: hydantoinase B/oxoprolinase family protein [Alicyclobacillus macrosporangiidus]|uniref:hydantoinase B/oxoprolinase family protein n=1 Tax=Alicyclobacillus macrosporangiidus TaxID=392015 RepID=UPI0026E97C0B|nr:hydantoinase B/oxoprolinase family protein [Alicyclobacillus macrosporangiidus]MCL6600781.1 hydantoinase B/oxoprolinase family protein [Alicyclobacillus macrosporangiidus]
MTIDSITVDIMENALKNVKEEMDVTLFRSAMSPVIREQHDCFPMITDPQGKMVVGNFGSHVPEVVAAFPEGVHEGDVIFLSDPYSCGGSISHINDWMIIVPVYFDGTLVGYASMFGHVMDVGGPVPISLPVTATSIFGEGIRVPPVKLFEQGVRNDAVIRILQANTRTPVENYSDLMAIVAACKTAEKRIQELCARFGTEVYLAALDALLERTNRMMRQLIQTFLPTQPVSFEDYVDDDGLGNGPFKMKLTIWREGDHAYFDWTGTDPQAAGPINYYLSDAMFKMFIGAFLISVFDPAIMFNDGFYNLLHITTPEGSLLRPKFPAALGCRTHVLSRLFDVLSGALSLNAPESSPAAGYGTSPYFIYSGHDEQGREFHLMEVMYGGLPGRPIGDGLDGHSWWPAFVNIPTEYLETYYPLRVEYYRTGIDSGGAGKHRGGNCNEKLYTCLASGMVSIHDDRAKIQPWGINGGEPGTSSYKILIKRDGTQVQLPSKVDNVRVEAGDQILFVTAGSGGWGDPLEREPERVQLDVARGLVSLQKAAKSYGVVLEPDSLEINLRATNELRAKMRAERGELQLFNFGRRRVGDEENAELN